MAAVSVNAGAQVTAPEYMATGNGTVTCQIFVYSPSSEAGLHLAYLDDNEKWYDVGQLCSSDYGQWGAQKKMHTPFVTQASDGTWRALWALNDVSPQFAVAYSEDLITWRPQDYPILNEKEIKEPIAYQMGDGSFDIYVKTGKGKRYIHADKDFRHFEEDSLQAEADDVLWQKDTATVNGKLQYGNGFEISKTHLEYIINWFNALAKDNVVYAEKMKDDNERFKTLPKTVEATLDVDCSRPKKISNKLIGVFFEDINYAADGGIVAELLQNGDFEIPSKEKYETENPLSNNNKHYIVLADNKINNDGWDGIYLKPEERLSFSFYARNISKVKKQFLVSLVAGNGEIVAQAKIKTVGNEWQKYSAELIVDKKFAGGKVTFCMEGLKDNTSAIDMMSLMPKDTYKGHGLRKDIAEVVAALKPKFVRFPGGCMLHGDGLDNIYNWKESVGELKDRKQTGNIWKYNQSRRLGFYEYFQMCEDMGAQPLPVLAAGVPCQNSKLDKNGIGGQQGGIPMKDMPQYIQDVLDLIEFANGEPTTKWGKLRADMGHATPFNLKMIGIGNEDLISSVFEERYLMICKAVKQKYPKMEVIGTVGPFHNPSSDYIEGWKIAKANKNVIDAVDEHYYEQTGWFLHNQDYYDEYDRKAPKVYLGEWASKTRTTESALAEAIHLCNVERNADVVEMASYAPLLCNEKHQNWNPDLIYFNNTDVKLTPSYNVQWLWGNTAGDLYMTSKLNMEKNVSYRVASSVVKDSKTGVTYLKLVNALPRKVRLRINGFVPTSVIKSFNDNNSEVEISGNEVILPAYTIAGLK